MLLGKRLIYKRLLHTVLLRKSRFPAHTSFRTAARAAAPCTHLIPHCCESRGSLHTPHSAVLRTLYCCERRATLHTPHSSELQAAVPCTHPASSPVAANVLPCTHLILQSSVHCTAAKAAVPCTHLIPRCCKSRGSLHTPHSAELQAAVPCTHPASSPVAANVPRHASAAENRVLKDGTAAASKPVHSCLLASAVRLQSGLSCYSRYHCFYRVAFILYCTVFCCIISPQRESHFCFLAAIVYCPVFH